MAVAEVVFPGSSGICKSSNLGNYRRSVVLNYLQRYIESQEYKLNEQEIQLLASYNDSLFKVN